jgi:hypothetical protein
MIGGLIRVLEGIFVVGTVGAAVVLILTLIEDAKMLFEKDENVKVAVVGD